MKTFSNIKFISRTGGFYETKFTASVDVTTTSGFWLWKKSVTVTEEIYAGYNGFFKYLSTGDFTEPEVDKLISIYNHTASKEERLKY